MYTMPDDFPALHTSIDRWYVLTVPHSQGARVVERRYLTLMGAAELNAVLERNNSPLRWLRDKEQ